MASELSPRDRPAKEIEITEDMIRAGAQYLFNSALCDVGTFDAARDIAETVIQLALDARRGASPRT
jgi:hypothetical protein